MNKVPKVSRLVEGMGTLEVGQQAAQTVNLSYFDI